MAEDRFRSLPPEIRLRVYSFVLVHRKPIRAKRPGERLPPLLEIDPKSMFLTCRTFCKEASPVFYSKNYFAIGSKPDKHRPGTYQSGNAVAELTFFLNRIGTVNADCVRNVRFNQFPWTFLRREPRKFRGELLQIMQSLQSFSGGLESLEIVLYDSTASHLYWMPNGIYRPLKGELVDLYSKLKDASGAKALVVRFRHACRGSPGKWAAHTKNALEENGWIFKNRQRDSL